MADHHSRLHAAVAARNSTIQHNSAQLSTTQRNTAQTIRRHLLALLLTCVCLARATDEVAAGAPLQPGAQHTVHQENTDAALQPLYRSSLEPDLRPHQARLASSGPGPYQLHHLASTMAKLLPHKYYKHNTLVTIKGGRLHTAPFAPGITPSPTPRRLAAIVSALEELHMQPSLALPDCVFILNTWDEPRCPSASPEKCDAPVLSLIKTWDAKRRVSKHTDILVPFFNHKYEEVVEYPWEQKDPRALMRAALQNGMRPNSTRMWLLSLSQRPEAAQLLDVGITNNLRKGLEVPIAPFMTLQEHARYKYLISADGFTASCRFGKLLGVNSVIVKEDSPWVEYYYRALSPGQHYLTFTKDSAWQVVQALPHLVEAEMQAMALRAQQFQQTYLSTHSKALYMRSVLLEYVQLFPPGAMAQFVTALDNSTLASRQLMQAKLAATKP